MGTSDLLVISSPAMTLTELFQVHHPHTSMHNIQDTQGFISRSGVCGEFPTWLRVRRVAAVVLHAVNLEVTKTGRLSCLGREQPGLMAEGKGWDDVAMIRCDDV